MNNNTFYLSLEEQLEYLKPILTEIIKSGHTACLQQARSGKIKVGISTYKTVKVRQTMERLQSVGVNTFTDCTDKEDGDYHGE